MASRLRSALGDDGGALGGRRLRRAPGPGALDAERFEELSARGREELTRGEPWEAAATLREALALWRGPALADVADERFAAPEIARLEDLRLACLSERIDADLACGRHAEVAGELEALVRAHPLRERLRAQQMLALYRSGRQADALDAYRGALPRARRRARHRAVARAARAGGGDPAPGRGPAPSPPQAPAPRAPAPRRRRRVTCVVSQLAMPTGSRTSTPSRCAAGSSATTTPPRAAVRPPRRQRRPSCAATRSWRCSACRVAHEDDPQRALRAAAELSPGRGAAVRRALRARRLHGRGRDAARRRVGDRRGGRRGRAARPRGRGGEIRMDEATWRLRAPRRAGVARCPTATSCCTTSTRTRRRSAAGSTGRWSGARTSSATLALGVRARGGRARRRG